MRSSMGTRPSMSTSSTTAPLLLSLSRIWHALGTRSRREPFHRNVAVDQRVPVVMEIQRLTTGEHRALRRGVEVYLALRLDPDRPGCVTFFYAGYRNESVGGRLLAEVVQRTVPTALGVPDRTTRGMSLPLLRETRMPAVIVEVGPASVVVERGPDLADALASALVTWATTPWD